MKKFKFRFSYFLILGFLGIIFQMISFFSWNEISVSQAELITSNKDMIFHFNNFIKSNYFVIASAVLLIALAVGIIMCSKKEQILLKSGAYVMSVSQLAIIVASIIYMIYLKENRANMFKITEEFDIASNLALLVRIKYTAIIISTIGLLSVSIGLLINKKEDKITRAGSIIGIVANGLFLLATLTVLISGMFLESYDVANSFISFSQKLRDPYELTHPYMNGFTIGHFNRIQMLLEEISLNSAALKALPAAVIIAFVSLIAYVISLVGNLFFLALTIIQSFDVSKDDNPMEI